MNAELLRGMVSDLMAFLARLGFAPSVIIVVCDDATYVIGEVDNGSQDR